MTTWLPYHLEITWSESHEDYNTQVYYVLLWSRWTPWHHVRAHQGVNPIMNHMWLDSCPTRPLGGWMVWETGRDHTATGLYLHTHAHMRGFILCALYFQVYFTHLEKCRTFPWQPGINRSTGIVDDGQIAGFCIDCSSRNYFGSSNN